MTFNISFSLEDIDSSYFWNLLRNNRLNPADMSEATLLTKTKFLCSEIELNAPLFLLKELDKVKSLVAMLEDPNWQMPKHEREDILAALNYFTNADDLIADDIPTLGFLDDLIMIELVAASLTDSIENFDKYCVYRDGEHSRSANKKITKQHWLADKRHEKHQRLRVRHARDHSSSSSFRSVF